MREILFRAWLGNEASPGSNEFMIYSQEYKSLSKFFAEYEGRRGNNKTLMLYTGRKDKAGIKIYEGDVIQCEMSFQGGTLPHKGEVVYLDEFAGYATKNEAGETLFHNHVPGSFEVLGNVMKNPELLTNKE